MTRNFTCFIILITFSCFVSCKKDIVTEVSGPTDGEMLISPSNSGDLSGEIVVMDKYGNTVFQRQTAADAHNFQKWVVDGKVRYTYLEHRPDAYQIIPYAIIPSEGVVLDESFNEIRRVSLMPYKGRTSSDPVAIDSHDFIYLGDDHFITLSYFQKPVNNIPYELDPAVDCSVVAPIIQETINNNVVWEWDGSDYPEFYLQSLEGNQFSDPNAVHDYMHVNSMFIDTADNNIICSIRNLDQVIKINRTSGEIMWRLGGSNSDFPMKDDMKFLRQHTASLTDKNQTLLIYDNGEIKERPYSRVVEFQLNEANKTINSFKYLNVPHNTFSQYAGSVVKRGDTYFIGGGTEAKVMEVNYKTGKVTFLMEMVTASYRAFKY